MLKASEPVGALVREAGAVLTEDQKGESAVSALAIEGDSCVPTEQRASSSVLQPRARSIPSVSRETRERGELRRRRRGRGETRGKVEEVWVALRRIMRAL
jgi:hypothetical protein